MPPGRWGSFSGFRDCSRPRGDGTTGRCRREEPGGADSGDRGEELQARFSRLSINVHRPRWVHVLSSIIATSPSYYCYHIPKTGPAARAPTAAGGGDGAAACPQQIHPSRKQRFHMACVQPAKTPILPPLPSFNRLDKQRLRQTGAVKRWG